MNSLNSKNRKVEFNSKYIKTRVKEHPPKQPRMMLTEKRIISYAGIRLLPYDGCGTRLYGRAKTLSISSVESGIAGGLTQI